MNQVKRISSDLTIVNTNNPTRISIGRSTLTNAELTVYGNLTVTGTTTTINSTELAIADNQIVLNSDVTGVPTENAGLIIERGSSPNSEIRWNETADRFEVFNGTSWAYVTTETTVGYLHYLSDDVAPALAGNLDVSTYSLTSTSSINFAAPIRLTNVVSSPVVQSGKSIIYANVSVGGGSGVFVASDASANEELVTRKQALIFSLIY